VYVCVFVLSHLQEQVAKVVYRAQASGCSCAFVPPQLSYCFLLQLQADVCRLTVVCIHSLCGYRHIHTFIAAPVGGGGGGMYSC